MHTNPWYTWEHIIAIATYVVCVNARSRARMSRTIACSGLLFSFLCIRVKLLSATLSCDTVILGTWRESERTRAVVVGGSRRLIPGE